MHKYQNFKKQNKEYYEKMLEIVGSLSRLFSENDAPYLDSRVAENLYCKSFDAENKGRDDSSVDAVYKKTGIGIKTFVGNSAQKVAEFNKAILQFSSLPVLEKAKKIAELRNKRIEFTKRAYGIDFVQYHCIRRERGKMIICEYPMDLIDIEKLKIIGNNGKSIKFTDSKNDYNFNISKSVLLKKFPRENIVSQFNVKILDDPFNVLDKTLETHKKDVLKVMELKHQFVVLPLYSIEKGNKVVPKRSSLNQWDAKGRKDKKGKITKRNENEAYIRIPSWIHKEFQGFFPKREVKFKLKLPNGYYMSAKVCQDNDKALMSDPNKALGKWILRDVLQLKEGELLTYEMLQEIGIDSVIIHKIGKLEYTIDFREEGEFEKFEEEALSVE